MRAVLVLLAAALQVQECEVEPAPERAAAPSSLSQADTGTSPLVCKNLLKAYFAGYAMPVPLLGTAPQFVALGVCCPSWIFDKLQAQAARARGAISDRVQSYLYPADVHALEAKLLLAGADAEEDRRDQERAEILGNYMAFVLSHRLENAGPNTHVFRRSEAPLRRLFTEQGSVKFDTKYYAANMAMMNLLEQEHPWVLFARLEHALQSDGDRDLFIRHMQHLKRRYPWLRATADNAALPADLRPEPEVEAIQVAARAADTADPGFYAAVVAPLAQRREDVCRSAGSLATRAVAKMAEMMTIPVAQFELDDLRQRVILAEARAA